MCTGAWIVPFKGVQLTRGGEGRGWWVTVPGCSPSVPLCPGAGGSSRDAPSHQHTPNPCPGSAGSQTGSTLFPLSLTFALPFLFLSLLWSRAGRVTVDVPGELSGTTSSVKCLFYIKEMSSLDFDPAVDMADIFCRIPLLPTAAEAAAQQKKKIPRFFFCEENRVAL